MWFCGSEGSLVLDFVSKTEKLWGQYYENERGGERKSMGYDVPQLVELLLSVHKVLGSMPSSLLPQHLGNEGRKIRVQDQPLPHREFQAHEQHEA